MTMTIQKLLQLTCVRIDVIKETLVLVDQLPWVGGKKRKQKAHITCQKWDVKNSPSPPTRPVLVLFLTC